MDRVLRRSRVRLYAASFLIDMVTAAYGLAVATCAKELLRADPAQLGYLGTALTGGYAIGCLLTSGWSDRRGSMALMRWGLALLFLLVLPATILGEQLESIGWFCATNAAYGLVLSLYWAPLMRQVSILSPGGILWRSIGVFNICWSIGMALGSYLGPVLYDRWDLAITLLFLEAMVILALAVLGARMADCRSEVEMTFQCQVDKAIATLFLHVARIAHFCASFAMGAVTFEFLYVARDGGIAVTTIAFILFFRDTGRFFAFVAMRFLSGWRYSFRWLLGIQAVAGLALILSGFATSAGQFLVLFFCLGVFTGVAYYSSLYYGLNLRSEEGRKSGLHETILAVGYCLGPLCAGGVGVLIPEWPGVVLALPGAVILLGLLVEFALLSPSRGSSGPCDHAE